MGGGYRAKDVAIAHARVTELGRCAVGAALTGPTAHRPSRLVHEQGGTTMLRVIPERTRAATWLRLSGNRKPGANEAVLDGAGAESGDDGGGDPRRELRGGYQGRNGETGGMLAGGCGGQPAAHEGAAEGVASTGGVGG